MIVICCATIPTMEAANKEVKSLQVELYEIDTEAHNGDTADQAIFHQSSDALFAGATWTESFDLNKIRRLIDMGSVKFSCNRRINKRHIKCLKGIPPHIHRRTWYLRY